MANDAGELVVEIYTDTIEVVSQDATPVQTVVAEEPVPIVITEGSRGPQGARGPYGPPGPQGEPGSVFDGTAWWYGEGVPGTIIGSKPGDYYLDTASGTVYKLGD